MSLTAKKKRKYYTLNYLRAIAFIAVSLFHRLGFIVKGGYLGVLIFLVLSGFLSSKTDQGKVFSVDLSIKKFINKLISLIAPVLFILASSLTFALFFAREIFDDSIKSALPVAFNFDNIRRILINEDYFNQLGNFNITTHLWYVSLFIQIILVYMIINLFISKRSDKLKVAVWSLIVLTSFVILLKLAKDNKDITRIYYGLDTRISAFGLGVLLFYISPIISKSRISKKALEIFILIIGLLVTLPFFLVDGKEIGSYRGLFISYTILVGLLILLLFSYENMYMKGKRATNPIAKSLSYIGDRSYHLYLWQYVIQIFSVYFMPQVGHKFLSVLIEISLIFILSELTYILFKNTNIKLSLIIISFVGLVILRIVSIKIGNDKSAEVEDLRTEITQNQADIKRRNEEAMKKAQEQNEYEGKSEADIKDEDHKTSDENSFINESPVIPETKKLEDNFTPKVYDDFNFTENELSYLASKKIVAVGDSVIINADSYIRRFIPNFYLDGEVGRDMTSGPSVLASLIGSVGESDTYLISLGSNGSANPADMDAIMAQTGNSDVYFINTSHTQPYMDYVNNSIAEYTKNHDRAHLIDWRSYIKDRPDYLAADRTHPNIPGSDAFAKLIMRAVLNVNKVKP